MRYLFTVLTFMTLSYSQAQHAEPYTVAVPNIRGKVKSIEELIDTIDRIPLKTKPDIIYRVVYGFDQRGKSIYCIRQLTNGTSINGEYTYNTKGLLAKFETYNNKKTSGQTIDYSYDDNDTLIEFSVTKPDKYKITTKSNGKGDIIQTEKYILDTLSIKKTRRGSIDKPYIETYKNVYHDEKLSEVYIYNQDTLVAKKTFKYHKNGNITEASVFFPNGDLEYKNLFVYDKNSNQTESIVLGQKGKTLTHQSEKYDDHKNRTDLIYYGENGNVSSSIHSEYKYDKNGNWIEQKNTFTIGPAQVNKRNIEYY